MPSYIYRNTTARNSSERVSQLLWAKCVDFLHRLLCFARAPARAPRATDRTQFRYLHTALPYASADRSIEYLSKEGSLHVEAGKHNARGFCSFIHLKTLSLPTSLAPH